MLDFFCGIKGEGSNGLRSVKEFAFTVLNIGAFSYQFDCTEFIKAATSPIFTVLSIVGSLFFEWVLFVFVSWVFVNSSWGSIYY